MTWLKELQDSLSRHSWLKIEYVCCMVGCETDISPVSPGLSLVHEGFHDDRDVDLAAEGFDVVIQVRDFVIVLI